GELAPRVDELVEVLVERLERPSEDVPVQLLADQREVDELDERCLELPSDLLALMLPQRRQMRFVCNRCHVSSFSGLSLPNESCPEHLPQSLELRWEASLLEVDAVAAHRHSLTQQQLALSRALRQAPVGPDDALPGQVVVGLREDEADEARGARIDVAVGAHEALRDRADALDYSVNAWRHEQRPGSPRRTPPSRSRKRSRPAGPSPTRSPGPPGFAQTAPGRALPRSRGLRPRRRGRASAARTTRRAGRSRARPQ